MISIRTFSRLCFLRYHSIVLFFFLHIQDCPGSGLGDVESSANFHVRKARFYRRELQDSDGTTARRGRWYDLPKLRVSTPRAAEIFIEILLLILFLLCPHYARIHVKRCYFRPRSWTAELAIQVTLINKMHVLILKRCLRWVVAGQPFFFLLILWGPRPHIVRIRSEAL